MAIVATINRPLRVSAARPALLKEFVRTVRRQDLFLREQHLLVAVSGGPDSIALLSLLDRLRSSWRLSLTVVHFNYGLRGLESDGDESFVQVCCAERDIPLVVQRPQLHTSRKHSSLQAVAREVRYAAMAQLADELGADRIVLGHTANDQAETILMWMLRGAGLTGLAGMPYVRDARIIRPLLPSTRENVLAYLAEARLSYRQDSSNGSSKYRRNRIRHEVMPAMVQVAPAAVRILQRQADLLREDERYLEEVAQECFERLVKTSTDGMQHLDRTGFAALSTAIQRRLLRTLLRAYDKQSRASGFQVIESVRKFLLSGRPGASLSLKRARLCLGRGAAPARFSPGNMKSRIPLNAGEDDDLRLSVPSSVHWSKTDQQIHTQRMSRREAEQTAGAPSKRLGLFDADRLSGPLTIRTWQAGDRFCPQGMRGRSKKLQDFFTDRKVGRLERMRIPLLVGPEGIAWVVGFRQDERYAVNERTTSCIAVSVSESEHREGVR